MGCVKEGSQPIAPEAVPKPKRKLSAAGRKAIIAATKKRWELKKAEASKAQTTAKKAAPAAKKAKRKLSPARKAALVANLAKARAAKAAKKAVVA